MSCESENPWRNIIPVVSTTTQKDVELIEGSTGTINIQDVSDADTFRFILDAVDFTPLTATLSLVAKKSGVIKSNPVLRGTVIDAIELSWVYNKDIASQTLTNTGGLTPPTLVASDTDFDYSSLTINGTISFTVQGNDGLGRPESIASDTKSVSFGDTMYIGKGASKINQSSTGLNAFINALATKVTKTSRSHTYYATGIANEKHFVAYPVAFGEGIFTKGIFSGGYVKLKLVGGILKQTLGIGDVESPIMITNSEGYSSAYYVYESLFDFQEDSVTPFIIS